MDFPKALMAIQITKQGEFKFAEQIVKDQIEADNFISRYTRKGVRIEVRKLTDTELDKVDKTDSVIESNSKSLAKGIKEIVTLYKQAVKNVPLLRYSWIIIATISILALAAFFELNNTDVFLYALFVIGISFLGFLFSYLLKTKDKFVKLLLRFLLTCIVLTIGIAVLGFGSFIIWKKPEFYNTWFPDLKNRSLTDSLRTELKYRKLLIQEMMNRDVYEDEFSTLRAVFDASDYTTDSNLGRYYKFEIFKHDHFDRLASKYFEQEEDFQDTVEKNIKKAWFLYYNIHNTNEKYFDSARNLRYSRLTFPQKKEFNEIILPGISFPIRPKS